MKTIQCGDVERSSRGFQRCSRPAFAAIDDDEGFHPFCVEHLAANITAYVKDKGEITVTLVEQ